MEKVKLSYKKIISFIFGCKKFFVYRNSIFTNRNLSVTSRIKLIKRGAPPINLKIVELHDEEFYLFVFDNDNIAHFFHDIFFPFYCEWRSHKKRVCVFINDNIFQKEFLETVIGRENLIFLDNNLIYSFSKIIITPEGRDLKVHQDYLCICNEIKTVCFEKHNIIQNRTINVIYTRGDLKRKRLLGLDQEILDDLNLRSVFLQSSNFKDYLTTLACAKSLTYVAGAGTFNLLFLSADVSVLEINPYKENSWAKKFGLNKLCNFKSIVSLNIATSNAAAQADPLLDSDIYFDKYISYEIEKLINR